MIVAGVGLVPLMSELSPTWQAAILSFIDVFLILFLLAIARNTRLKGRVVIQTAGGGALPDSAPPASLGNPLDVA